MRILSFSIYLHTTAGYSLKDFDLENAICKAIVLEMLCHVYNSGQAESEEIEDNESSLKDIAIVKTKE